MKLEFHQLDQRYGSLRARSRVLEKHLLSSIAETGQQIPILVVAEGGSTDRFVVIDGFKRIFALQRLGYDTVESLVLDLTEADALLMMESLRLCPGDTLLEQGWLLHELQRSFGWSQEELARRFARSATWVSRRLALVTILPEDVQEKIQKGQIGAQAAMRFLVPMARMDRGACEELAKGIAGPP